MPADRETLLALADRLERAEGPEFGLDVDAWAALTGESFVRHNCFMWTVDQDRETDRRLPRLTASLDACRELHERLLPGFGFHVFSDCGSYFARVEHMPETEWVRYGAEAGCASCELAWLAAMCRALAAAPGAAP